MEFKWRPITEWPEHDGWIWLTTGNKGGGSKIRVFYFKRENQIKHGHTRIKDIKVGILNNAKFWMYAIPIPAELKKQMKDIIIEE